MGNAKVQRMARASSILRVLRPGSYQVQISLDHYLPTQVPVSIRANSNTVLPAKLQPELPPVKAAVVETSPPAPIKEDHSADFQGIQDALHNFEAAYNSRNMSRIQATWLNIGARSKSLAGVLEAAEMVNIQEICEGQPAINGSTATQSCTEVSKYSKGDPPRKAPKTITFTKANGKWVMKDKMP